MCWCVSGCFWVRVSPCVLFCCCVLLCLFSYCIVQALYSERQRSLRHQDRQAGERVSENTQRHFVPRGPRRMPCGGNALAYHCGEYHWRCRLMFHRATAARGLDFPGAVVGCSIGRPLHELQSLIRREPRADFGEQKKFRTLPTFVNKPSSRQANQVRLLFSSRARTLHYHHGAGKPVK